MKRRNFLKGLFGVGASFALPNISFANSKSVRIGVVSDLEGAFENISKSVLKLKKAGVNLIIICGDVYENEQIRRNPTYPNSVDNLEEMVLGIKPYAELKVPVYVISGNHEDNHIFNMGIKKLNELGYKNVINSNNSFFDLGLFSIVSIGGYHHPRFTAKKAKLIGKHDYNLLESNFSKALSLSKPVVFVSHGPPLTNSKVDKISAGMNVGDKVFRNIMLHPMVKNVIHVFGHIHEAGGNYFNFSEDKVSVNVSSITDYNSDKKVRACIIEVKDKKFEWNFI